MKAEAENQRFQDILLASECVGFVQICILPHITFYLSAQQVAIILQLMEIASKPNASYEDQNNGVSGVSVERMKDENAINIGDFRISGLLDSQWVAIYRALKDWQNWNDKGDGDQWRAQITPNRKAYQLWNKSLSEKQTAQLIEQNFMDIFNNDGVSL